MKVTSKLDGKTSDIKRFTAQKAVKIRTAEGRSASASAQAVAATALKARYGEGHRGVNAAPNRG